MALTKLNYTGQGTIPIAKMPTDSVIQVKQTVKKDTTSTQSATPEAISGMTVNLTCASTSSKVLISWNIYIGAAANGYGTIQLFIGGSASSFIGDVASNRLRGSGGSFFQSSINNLINYSGSFLYAPSSTSAIDYALYWQKGAEPTTIYLNREAADDDNTNHTRGVSTITVMEIAG